MTHADSLNMNKLQTLRFRFRTADGLVSGR